MLVTISKTAKDLMLLPREKLWPSVNMQLENQSRSGKHARIKYARKDHIYMKIEERRGKSYSGTESKHVLTTMVRIGKTI